MATMVLLPSRSTHFSGWLIGVRWRVERYSSIWAQWQSFDGFCGFADAFAHKAWRPCYRFAYQCQQQGESKASRAESRIPSSPGLYSISHYGSPHPWFPFIFTDGVLVDVALLILLQVTQSLADVFGEFDYLGSRQGKPNANHEIWDAQVDRHVQATLDSAASAFSAACAPTAAK